MRDPVKREITCSSPASQRSLLAEAPCQIEESFAFCSRDDDDAWCCFSYTQDSLTIVAAAVRCDAAHASPWVGTETSQSMSAT